MNLELNYSSIELYVFKFVTFSWNTRYSTEFQLIDTYWRWSLSGRGIGFDHFIEPLQSKA